ncbi:hypothetical protein H8356DRAFT_949312 [Neocallimastix lanati (nom. inval.)]|uniref:THO complex subunit 5 n=1 Tax=Neocallimastix californiae TaxID=1754190 RepID=A0A1Y1ZMI2_9FUNG|nr:hypothetical protein H8356DRAFT_949312 [Neocallimastix sp. JGI-2020a]ORY11473.1 hypothetical protein LY90DRAFT_708793 [Neocallimastix californiae]|eukprot:ORY11473.1 hypothetical protein LY90DRAFT_708793 [Neocallimastix californiae]
MLSKEENSRNIKVLEDTCQSLRKLLDELFQEREKRLMNNEPIENIPEDILTTSSLLTMDLKQINRTLYIDNRNIKQEFLEVAPDSLKNGNDNPHRQMINRLSFELEERKRLSKAEKELIDDKKKINEKLIKQKEKLNQIDEQLEQMIKNSFTLQESLKLPQTYVRKQNEISLLLPEPLFILYKQAIGYQEAYDNKISTEILGDPSMVSSFIQKGKSKKDNNDTNSNSRASPISSVHSSPSLGPKKKHNRHSSSTYVSSATSKSNSLYKIFPLRIQIKFKKLNIVTVVPVVQNKFKSISSLSFLSCLFKNDTGEVSPNPANALLFIHKEDKKTFSFQPDKEYGYAYSWAQVICGLDFAPIISYEKNIVFSDNNNEIDDPHKLMRYPCFAEIVDLIEERVHSIEALENQISQLSDGKFIVESHINIKELPVKLLYLKMNDLNNFDIVIRLSIRADLNIPNSYPDSIITFKLLKYNIKLNNEESSEKAYQSSVNEDDSMMEVDDENDIISVKLKSIEEKINNVEELKKFLENENREKIEPGNLISYQLYFLLSELSSSSMV